MYKIKNFGDLVSALTKCSQTVCWLPQKMQASTELHKGAHKCKMSRFLDVHPETGFSSIWMIHHLKATLLRNMWSKFQQIWIILALNKFLENHQELCNFCKIWHFFHKNKLNNSPRRSKRLVRVFFHSPVYNL